MKYMVSPLVLAGTCLCALADVTLTAETEYSVSGGVTNNLTEKISGVGSIRKTGGGTLVLSNGANDFSGGVAVETGCVNATVTGALGTGLVSVGAKGASVHFGSYGAAGTVVVANDISVSGNAAEGFLSSPIKSDGIYSVFLCSDTVISGDINASRNFRISAPTDSTGQDSVFDGDINAPGKSVWVDPYGSITFNGAIEASALYFAGQWGTKGFLYLNSQDNRFDKLYVGNPRIVCGGPDVLGGAAVSWCPSGSFLEGYSHVDLNGHGQSVKSISILWTDWTDKSRYYNGDRQCFKSENPATLTLTGAAGSAEVKSYATLRGKVSLLVDAKEHPSFVQEFVSGENTTEGPITVSNGTLKVSLSSCFPNVPSVIVGPAGKLILASTNDIPAFAGLKSLTVDGMFDLSDSKVFPFSGELDTLVIGENAKLILPEGAVLAAKSVVFAGTPLEAHDWKDDSASQIQGGKVFCSGAGAAAVTWTGAGESDGISSQANWKDGFDVFSTDWVMPSFAAGGDHATVDADVYFGGMTFSAAAGKSGFSIERDDDGHGIFLNGDVVAAEADEAKLYEIDADVTIPVIRDINLDAAENQTVVFRDAFVAGSSKGRLNIKGSGSVKFEGTNVIDGSICSGDSCWTVSGLLGTPDHADQGDPEPDGKNSISIAHVQHLGWASKIRGIMLANAVIEKPIYIANHMEMHSLGTADATTNEIKGAVHFWSQAWQPIRVGNHSELIFSGGFRFGHYFRPLVLHNAALMFRSKPVHAFGENAKFNPLAGKTVLEVAGNTFSDVCIGDGTTTDYNVSLEMTVSGAMTNGNLLVGINGSRLSRGEVVSMNTSKKYTLEINCTTQRCEKLAVADVGIVNGTYPAMIDVTTGRRPSDHAGYHIAGKVTGGVGFRMSGADDAVLLFTNRVFASCGDLEVVSGTMEFADDATWLNGTNVTVSGTGTLALGRSNTFTPRKAQLFISGNGKLHLPEGVSQTFNHAFIDGVRLGAGMYTASALPEHLSGDGRLLVRSHGTVFMVR